MLFSILLLWQYYVHQLKTICQSPSMLRVKLCVFIASKRYIFLTGIIKHEISQHSGKVMELCLSSAAKMIQTRTLYVYLELQFTGDSLISYLTWMAA